jgi:acylphosphatase
MGVIGRHITISGRVQGVFFRDSLRRQAETHGVAGWARNTREGEVEAVLEGDEDAVQRVVEWARGGPSRAHVTDVKVEQRESEGLTTFEIR